MSERSSAKPSSTRAVGPPSAKNRRNAQLRTVPAPSRSIHFSRKLCSPIARRAEQ